MQTLRDVVVAVHVLAMVGAFGSLLMVQFGLPRDLRDSAAGARLGSRLPSLLLALGFVAGLCALGLYGRLAADMGGRVPTSVLHMVGGKFVLLLVAGAALGIGTKKLRVGLTRPASNLRLVALVALALAALLALVL